ncbi:neutral zinc metallopeptidase [Clostridium sp. CAG:1193]|nr:neutral zinc metallopeptidase [Clostridium sp. CAG:1193]
MNLILIILPIVLILLSQAYINTSYRKYSRVSVKSKITGASVARMILDKNGLNDVEVVKISGELTDNFNPRTNVVSLSSEVYSGNSIASVAVAAHECGHVIQHKEKYAFIVLRSILVPVVNLTTNLGYIIMLIGIFASVFDMAMIGFIMMCASLLFQLVTLPTEFNASKRGRNILLELNVITNDELPYVKSMLNAAAMTYLASFFASITQMLRLFLSINRNNRD